jgi:hypothetical protein
MSHPRRIIWATLAVALCVATVAAGYNPARQRDAVIAPARGGGLTGGELLGEAWARSLAQPTGQADAFAGSCVTLAHDVIAPHFGDNGTATCTGTRATQLLVFWGSECSNRDTPATYTRAAQLACARTADRAIKALTVTVDGGDTVDIVRPRFELFSPQRTIVLPPDNVFGTAERTATFTAHAWGAVIRSLRPGRHTVRFAVALGARPDDRFTLTILLTIHPAAAARPGHGD